MMYQKKTYAIHNEKKKLTMYTVHNEIQEI